MEPQFFGVTARAAKGAAWLFFCHMKRIIKSNHCLFIIPICGCLVVCKFLHFVTLPNMTIKPEIEDNRTRVRERKKKKMEREKL